VGQSHLRLGSRDRGTSNVTASAVCGCLKASKWIGRRSARAASTCSHGDGSSRTPSHKTPGSLWLTTPIQYALVSRAQALGWADERILAVDEDLGKSGTSAQGRAGFQRPVSESEATHAPVMLEQSPAGRVAVCPASRLRVEHYGRDPVRPR
jgi:hypothetical protein